MSQFNPNVISLEGPQLQLAISNLQFANIRNYHDVAFYSKSWDNDKKKDFIAIASTIKCNDDKVTGSRFEYTLHRSKNGRPYIRRCPLNSYYNAMNDLFKDEIDDTITLSPDWTLQELKDTLEAGADEAVTKNQAFAMVRSSGVVAADW
jgi:hypothetical protein